MILFLYVRNKRKIIYNKRRDKEDQYEIKGTNRLWRYNRKYQSR